MKIKLEYGPRACRLILSTHDMKSLLECAIEGAREMEIRHPGATEARAVREQVTEAVCTAYDDLERLEIEHFQERGI